MKWMKKGALVLFLAVSVSWYFDLPNYHEDASDTLWFITGVSFWLSLILFELSTTVEYRTKKITRKNFIETTFIIVVLGVFVSLYSWLERISDMGSTVGYFRGVGCCFWGK